MTDDLYIFFYIYLYAAKVYFIFKSVPNNYVQEEYLSLVARLIIHFRDIRKLLPSTHDL